MSSYGSLFYATLVHTPKLGKLEILHGQLIAVDSNGFIASICPRNSPEAQPVLDSAHSNNPPTLPVELPLGSFLTPTFVDLHLHAPQFMYLGTGLHLPLLRWLDEYAYKAEEGLDADPRLALKVYSRLCDRLIEAGTGAVLAFGTIKEDTNLILAQVMQDKGMRGFIGKLSMDTSSRPTYVEKSPEESLRAAASFIHRCRSSVSHLAEHSRLVEPVITPRFVPTCSDELLEGLGRLAAVEGTVVQSHLAEARDQVDWVRNTRNAEDMEVFKKCDLLTSRTVQAHCTFLDLTSLSHLQDFGTSIAHCPLSNAYFSSRSFPLREALDLGVKVGLGTDVAGGYQIDIMNAMRMAVVTSRAREGARSETVAEPISAGSPRNLSVDWKEALFLATKGGAEVLSLNSGTFAVGSRFDAQQINLLDETMEGLGALDFFDLEIDAKDRFAIDEGLIEKWWCLGDTRNRGHVWIQGKQLK